MMHKTTLHSLLIVSFIAVFAASMSFAADEVIVGSSANLLRCSEGSVGVTLNLDADVSAVEVIVDVHNLTGCGDITNVSVVVDLDGAYLADRPPVDMSQYPLIRFAAMSTGQTPDYLPAGPGIQFATISFETVDCDLGEAEIAGATWPAAPPFGPIVTQFVDAGTSAIRQVSVTAGVIGMANVAPTMTEIVGGPFTILHGDLFEYTLESTDPDLNTTPGGCEIHTYQLLNGPDGMTIESGNVLTWQTDGDDVCEFAGDIEVQVTDKYGKTDAADVFQICVTNTPPHFTAYPTETIVIGWGDVVATTLAGVDPDPGPYGPVFHVVNWGYPVAPPVIADPNSGDLEWATGYGPEWSGVFEIEVEISDLANECDPCAPANSETVSFFVEVNAFALTISKEEAVLVGQSQTVTISMLDEMYLQPQMGGFDLLIQYDASAMSFQLAEEGSFLTNCKWEYFTYRYGANGNCGGPCPSGVLRIVGMAESTGGNLADHPICTNTDQGTSEDLAYLHFMVGTDANLECNFAAIRFVWYDCADNGVSTTFGDSLLISSTVWDFAGFDPAHTPIFNDITGMDQSFPTLTGAPDIAECNQDIEGWKRPWRLVHYFNGGLDIACAEDLDAVGDININQLAYEIADAVMFTNYFISGLSAFGSHQAGSIAASDTNKDGITLSVADLVYLIRVVVGDALPYAKVEPIAARVTYGNDTFGVDLDMGAAYIVVEGNVTPTLLATNMDMKVGFDGQNTNILVYSLEANQSFTGNFLEASGNIVSTEFATFTGQPVLAKLVPTSFEVSQNYPNPFNPSTKIQIQIPNAGAWSMDIYNINGQLVESFSGVSESGFEDVVWDASRLSSGVYFYKVVAGSHSLVKKAVLLK